MGETLITGIGQGYIQSTPLQLTLMTAQLANGGNKIYPTLIPSDKTIDQIKKEMGGNDDYDLPRTPPLVK